MRARPSGRRYRCGLETRTHQPRIRILCKRTESAPSFKISIAYLRSKVSRNSALLGKPTHLYPFPTSPMTFSDGTLMSSKSRVQVDDALIPSWRGKGIAHGQLPSPDSRADANRNRTFFSFLAILTPISFSTRKHVIPLYPLLVSTLAKTCGWRRQLYRENGAQWDPRGRSRPRRSW